MVFAFLTIVSLDSCSSTSDEVIEASAINQAEKAKQNFTKIASQMNLIAVENKIETRSDKECWNSESDNCTVFQATYTIEYQSCDFVVANEISACFDDFGNVFFVTGELVNINSDWFTDPNCYNVSLSFLALFINGDKEGLNDAIDTWHYALEMGWEANFVNDYILNSGSQSYYCDQPETNANVVVDNYVGTCYRRCFSNDAKNGFSWTDLRCGYGCCRRTSEYCVDRNTGELVIRTDVIQLESCSFEPEPLNGCKFLTECSDDCSKIR